MTKLVLYLFLVQFLGANAQPHGSLRLVSGNSSNEGRLEVYNDGEWGTVCSDYWDYDNAQVACRQLGYIGVVESLTSLFPDGSSSQRIWLDDVRCTGRESKLINCRSNGLGNEDCTHSQDVGIICTTNISTRLIGSGSQYRGRVEVYYRGQWRAVCPNYYDKWNFVESSVACRQLGYTRAIETTQVYNPGNWSDAIAVSCSDIGSSLTECNFNGYCSYRDQQVYIECTNSSASSELQSDGDVRLVGGGSQYEGRVEIYYRGLWLAACLFSYRESSVVCRQLGYGLLGRTTGEYNYRSGSDSVYVTCSGDESSLSKCNIRPNTYSCYGPIAVECTNSNVYPPHVWTILIPLVCGLIVLCVLCVPCVVAYCLYRKKKPRASPVPGNTAEGTVQYTTSDEQPRVGSPTLPSTDREGEVQINYHSDDSVIRVDTTVGPGLVAIDQPQDCIESPPPSIQQD